MSRETEGQGSGSGCDELSGCSGSSATRLVAETAERTQGPSTATLHLPIVPRDTSTGTESPVASSIAVGGLVAREGKEGSTCISLRLHSPLGPQRDPRR